MSENTQVLGLSIGLGKKDEYWVCLLENYPNQDRWFVSSLKKFSSDFGEDGLIDWIRKNKIKKCYLDIPFTIPTCEICDLKCPGQLACEHPETKKMRESIRINQKEKMPKAMKKRSKIGYNPIYHRPFDFWVWQNKTDPMQEQMAYNYEGFFSLSYKQVKKVKYLRTLLESDTIFFESNKYLLFLELSNHKIISKKLFNQLKEFDTIVRAKEDLILGIEEDFILFLSDADFEIIRKQPKALACFLSALSGLCHHQGKNRVLDDMFRSSLIIIPNLG